MPDHLAGKSDICLKCGQEVTVPMPEPAAGFADLGDDANASPFAGLKNRNSEQLWSSYGRDALFLAGLSVVLMIFICVVPGVGIILSGAVGLIAMIMAIRALVTAGSRSSKGMAFAIVALVLSLIPVGLASLSCLGFLLSFVAR